MKVPLSWLKDYVDISIPVTELAEKLTIAGLEVETIEYIGLLGAELPWDTDLIVVGEITAVQQHPNADRLTLAEVNYGGDESELVVSGPPSLLPLRGQSDLHLKVAFAKEGSALWDPYSEQPRIRKLKRSKIRGVFSRAMVCSEKELGLSDEHEDILYLPDDAPVGAPLADYIGDAVLEFDIKGPFGHLQSVFGIAREVAALLGSEIRRDAIEVLSDKGMQLSNSPEYLDLEIPDPDLCPRYSTALICDVTVGPAPFWMQTRLRRAGMRPINNIVDITNYVMLELGQPLHAFDHQVLRSKEGQDIGAIIVRRAHAGERMATLDGQMREFDEEMLLITDGQGPVAVAGVMGGLDSEVTHSTKQVLLESANFHFLSVRRTSRLLGLNSDASYRFGRRVDPELSVTAAARAAHLMAELAGGRVDTMMGDLYPGRQPETVIDFNPDYVERVLGIEVPPEDVVSILSSLEFGVKSSSSGHLSVSVPSYRLDVRAPVDLVEEVGRIWGYDRFPTRLMRDELPPQRANPRLEHSEMVRDILTGSGLDEVITYSLTTVEREANLWLDTDDHDASHYLHLRNPAASNRTTLRQSLLPGMLDAVGNNLRFIPRVDVFEIGAVYIGSDTEALPDEPRRLGLVLTGPREGRSWLSGQDQQMVGFFDLKGTVEALLGGLGLSAVYEPAHHASFHPGRCAQVVLDGRAIGVMGELHPLVRNRLGLPDQPVCALEFDLDVMLEARAGTMKVKPVSVHPPVYEDIALIVDEGTTADQMEATIRAAGGALMRGVQLFDVYRGDQVGAGKKSMAYALTFQDDIRTLKDAEVAKVRGRIVRRLTRDIGAVLRG